MDERGVLGVGLFAWIGMCLLGDEYLSNSAAAGGWLLAAGGNRSMGVGLFVMYEFKGLGGRLAVSAVCGTLPCEGYLWGTESGADYQSQLNRAFWLGWFVQ